LWSCRYREQPLLIQGPGAGAEVTAAALLDDVARLAHSPFI
jgi:homoserine dehydrogenase